MPLEFWIIAIQEVSYYFYYGKRISRCDQPFICKKSSSKIKLQHFLANIAYLFICKKKSLLENVIENYKNNFQEAEQNGFTAEDVQVALNHCGDANPVAWLKENWDNMMETVVTLGMVTNKM